MATLEEAEKSLNQALERLETALKRRLVKANGGEPPRSLSGSDQEHDALRRDVAALGTECERLRAELHEVREENRSLREASTTVASRLDGSIAEIDRILGN